MSEVGRILGVDFGSRRIGLAVSDPLRLIAHALPTVEADSLPEAVAAVTAAARKAGVERVVIGLPLNLNGSEGPQAKKTRDFAARLRQALNLPLEFSDERLSSRCAERVLLEADLSRSRRKAVIDRLSAQIILQGYLDSRRLEAMTND